MTLVPGFVDRPADPTSDLDAVAAVMEASDRDLHGDAESPRQFVEYTWRSSWVDVPTMTRVVVGPSGDVAAYAEVESVDPSLSLEGWACVHPSYRGQGLGSALADWVERTALAVASPGVQAVFHHTIPAADREAAAILRARGLRHVNTSWHMRTPLDPSSVAGPVPAGVTIRTSRLPEDEVAIHDTLVRAFEGSFGWSFVPLDRFWSDARADPAFTPDRILVAERGGGVVGVSWQGVEPPIGWIFELGVRPEAQRKGIGRALLRHALADLSRRELPFAQLNVDSGNPFGAVDLYRSVGMEVHREWWTFGKPLNGGGAPGG